MDDIDELSLPENEWRSIAENVDMEENRMMSAMGRPQGCNKSRKRQRQEAKVLQENRLKFLESWVAAFNSGCSKAMEQFMMTWVNPDVVYREQFVHFVPQTLIYREIHSSRLLYQYVMAMINTTPDCVYLNTQQTLKKKRDGSAYVISTVRIVGNYTFRLLTTNASSHVSQFLTQANPLRAVMNNDHLLNRTLFKSFMRGQQQSLPSFYVSSIPAVYHPYPVEYDAVNGVLIPKGIVGAPHIPLPAFEGYENAASTLVKSSIITTTDGGDVVNFDDEELFRALYQALLVPDNDEEDDDEGNVSGDENVPAKRVMLLDDDDAAARVSSISSSSSDAAVLPVHDPRSYAPQRIAPSTLSVTRPPSWLSRRAPAERTEEELLREAQRDVLVDKQRAADTLRNVLTLLPPSGSEASTRPSSVNIPSAPPSPADNTADKKEEEKEDVEEDVNRGARRSMSSSSASTEDHTVQSKPASSTDTSSFHNLPNINPTPQPVSIYDFIKVSTPYTQFFALEKLPRQYRVDFHQTMILYFETGSDQVHRIDVYKKIS